MEFQRGDQAKIAYYSNLTRQQVNDYLHGRKRPSWVTAAKLHRASKILGFDLSREWWMSRKGD